MFWATLSGMSSLNSSSKSKKNIHAVQRIDAKFRKRRVQRDLGRVQVLLSRDDLNNFR